MINDLNGLDALDAVTSVHAEFALQQAEAEIREESLLAGVPLAHKELYRRESWPDEAGPQALKMLSPMKLPLQLPTG